MSLSAAVATSQQRAVINSACTTPWGTQGFESAPAACFITESASEPVQAALRQKSGGLDAGHGQREIHAPGRFSILMLSLRSQGLLVLLRVGSRRCGHPINLGVPVQRWDLRLRRRCRADGPLSGTACTCLGLCGPTHRILVAPISLGAVAAYGRHYCPCHRCTAVPVALANSYLYVRCIAGAETSGRWMPHGPVNQGDQLAGTHGFESPNDED